VRVSYKRGIAECAIAAKRKAYVEVFIVVFR